MSTDPGSAPSRPPPSRLVPRVIAGLGALAVVPVIAALRSPGIEKERPLWTLGLITIAAALAATSAFSMAGGEGSTRLGTITDALKTKVGERALSVGALAAAALFYALFMTRLTIAQHRGLGTHVSDLGYYDNILYQSSHGHFLGCSFLLWNYHGAAHFDPILVLLSPLYRLRPGAESLLAFQSFWLASGVVPIYLLGRRLLESRAVSVLLALSYLAYPALAGANAYDFHSLTLAVLPLLWLAYFFEARNEKGYLAALAITLLCREDTALLLCFVALAMLLSRREGAARTAGITLVASLVYFALVRLYLMPAAPEGDSGQAVKTYWYYYQELAPNGSGPREIAESILFRPLFVLNLITREAKVVFLLQLFLPLAFLPLLANRGRVALLYGLAFCLLASRPAVFDIHHQYPSLLFPVAFALTPYALRRLRHGNGRKGTLNSTLPRRSYAAALAAMSMASLLASYKLGPFVPNASFRAGATPLVRSLTAEQEETYAWVKEQAARIPLDASVGASQTLGPHVSSRMRAYFYPDRLDVDWVFIDEGETVGEGLGAHHKAIRSGALIEVARHGRLALFQRR